MGNEARPTVRPLYYAARRGAQGKSLLGDGEHLLRRPELTEQISKLKVDGKNVGGISIVKV